MPDETVRPGDEDPVKAGAADGDSESPATEPERTEPPQSSPIGQWPAPVSSPPARDAPGPSSYPPSGPPPPPFPGYSPRGQGTGDRYPSVPPAGGDLPRYGSGAQGPSSYGSEGYGSFGNGPQGWGPNSGPAGYGPQGTYPYLQQRGPVDSLGRPMAEWWQRFLAYLIDGLILLLPEAIIIGAAAGPNTNTTFGSASDTITRGEWVGLGIALIVNLGYFAFMDGSRRGQTIGKMALGIAVRDINHGGPIGAARALLRRVVFMAFLLGTFILFLVNALWPLWDRRRQGLHDKVVASCVVKVR